MTVIIIFLPCNTDNVKHTSGLFYILKNNLKNVMGIWMIFMSVDQLILLKLFFENYQKITKSSKK